MMQFKTSTLLFLHPLPRWLYNDFWLTWHITSWFAVYISKLILLYYLCATWLVFLFAKLFPELLVVQTDGDVSEELTSFHMIYSLKFTHDFTDTGLIFIKYIITTFSVMRNVHIKIWLISDWHVGRSETLLRS